MKVAINSYEGLYEVSSSGDVSSLGAFIKLRNKVVGNLKPGDCRGYSNVVLTNRKGERKTHLVHRLVAQAFLPNPLNLRCVNHKDEDKKNNKLDNLEWCTDQYNKEYSSSTTVTFLSPNKEEIRITNLSRFCRENSLQQANMHKVLQGERNHHKGWTLPISSL